MCLSYTMDCIISFALVLKIVACFQAQFELYQLYPMMEESHFSTKNFPLLSMWSVHQFCTCTKNIACFHAEFKLYQLYFKNRMQSHFSVEPFALSCSSLYGESCYGIWRQDNKLQQKAQWRTHCFSSVRSKENPTET